MDLTLLCGRNGIFKLILRCTFTPHSTINNEIWKCGREIVVHASDSHFEGIFLNIKADKNVFDLNFQLIETCSFCLIQMAGRGKITSPSSKLSSSSLSSPAMRWSLQVCLVLILNQIHRNLGSPVFTYNPSVTQCKYTSFYVPKKKKKKMPRKRKSLNESK